MKLPALIKSATRVLAAGVATALLLAPAGASEREEQIEQEELFDLIDTSKDGKVTEEEFAVFILWEEFRQFDPDKDGKVTKEAYMKVTKDKDLYAELDPKDRGYFNFDDARKSPTLQRKLAAEWQKLLAKLKKPKGTKAITKNDLP